MANNLENLSDAVRKTFANSPEICDLLVATYNIPGEILDFVRKATSASDAIDRATRARSYTDKLVIDLGGTVARSGATFSDVKNAMNAARLEVVNLEEGPEGICKGDMRWDPITQTCVPR